VKKISCPTFFCSQKYHKLKIILFLSRKNCGPILKKIIELFTPKNVIKLSKRYVFGIQDPGSGKNQFRIPDPGVKKAPNPRSGSATLHDNSVSGKFGYHPGVLAESRKLETKQ
jgi:hypothetical protein